MKLLELGQLFKIWKELYLRSPWDETSGRDNAASQENKTNGTLTEAEDEELLSSLLHTDVLRDLRSYANHHYFH